jgi:hypothetical protein
VMLVSSIGRSPGVFSQISAVVFVIIELSLSSAPLH